MKIAVPLTASLVLVTAMAAASLLSWWLLGSDADLAIHFGLDGTPNRYASAPIALSVIPVAAAVATLIFAFTPRFDPKASASPRLYRSLWLFVLLVLTAGHALIIGHALTKAG